MAKYKKEVVVFILAIFLLSAIVYASSNESNKKHSILERMISYQNVVLAWNREKMMGKIPEKKKIPILMYHDVSKSNNYVSITPENFEEHMKWLSEEGYIAITSQDIINFVEKGESLPDKPILITFDDGYYSNYEYGYPLLQKYNLKATIFIIGSSVGHKEFYKDTNYKLTPHFSYEEANEMENSGVISIECHTYDMHQNANYEVGDEIRTRAIKLEKETDASFRKAMRRDFKQFQKELKKNMNKEVVAFAYPYGAYDALSNEVLAELGVQISFSTEEGVNTVTEGNKEDLICMKRFNMNDNITIEKLQELIEQ